MSMLNRRIGNFVVKGPIGRGGMASVYEATHVRNGGRFAIKFLNPELRDRKDVVARFLNEGRAAGMVQHPGVVRIFDCEETPEFVYMIMEFLTGETLGERLRQKGSFSLAETLRIARQIASALKATHDAGIYHRDLKPENIIIVEDGDTSGGERAKVVDFGIAKVPRNPVEVIEETVDLHGIKTQIGVVMGTPSYMSPEQCKSAGEVDGRTDVYALGMILYQMLAGKLPFVGGPQEVMAMQLLVAPPPLATHCPHLPAPVLNFVHRLIAKEAKDRPDISGVLGGLESLGAPRSYSAATSLPPNRTPPESAPSSPSLSEGNGSASSQVTWFGGRLRVGLALLVLGLALPLVVLGIQQVQPTSSPKVAVSPIDLSTPQAPPDLLPTVDLVPSPVDLRSSSVPAPQSYVQWQISSEPEGAQILREGLAIGVTPFVLKFERGAGRIQVQLQRKHYHPYTLEVDLSKGGRKHVELTPSFR